MWICWATRTRKSHDLPNAETAYRKAVELDPSELSHLRGLGQTLLAEEKYPEALEVYQKLTELMPDDADNYLRMAQIYRELHQLDKAEDNLVKAQAICAGQPGSDVQRGDVVPGAGPRFEDAIRVLSDAVTGVKSQSTVTAVAPAFAGDFVSAAGAALSRHAELSARRLFTYQELARLGEEEDRRARLLMMDTYHAGERFAEGAADRKRSDGQISRAMPRSGRAKRCCWARTGRPMKRVKTAAHSS